MVELNEHQMDKNKCFDIIVFGYDGSELHTFVVWDMTLNRMEELSASMTNHGFTSNGICQITDKNAIIFGGDDGLQRCSINDLPVWDMELGLNF